MKYKKNMNNIFRGFLLLCLGIKIEISRKKLNKMIEKGFTLHSAKILQANATLDPLILKWQKLELTQLNAMFESKHKSKGGKNNEIQRKAS